MRRSSVSSNRLGPPRSAPSGWLWAVILLAALQEIPAELYMVWWFRDGKAVRMEMYNTSDQAEAAFAR